MSSPTISVDLQVELYDVVKKSPKNEIKNKWEQNGNKWSDEIDKLTELYYIQMEYLEKSLYAC
jgi:hypothetical protein